MSDDHQLAVPAVRGRRRRRPILCTLLAAGALAILVFHNPLFNHNFGVVEPGRVYRSAQPGANLAELIKEHHLASVLNLRGGTPSDSFYANEVSVTQKLGVEFYDFPMSAIRRPTRRELMVLIEFFEKCHYPLLIHCKSGSDRTGLASALYLIQKGSRTPDEALNAFSLYYGHVPLGNTARLHEPFREYAEWLKRGGTTHTPAELRDWASRVYAAADSETEHPPLLPGPRERREVRQSASRAARKAARAALTQ